MKLQHLADAIMTVASQIAEETETDYDYAIGMVIADELIPYLNHEDDEALSAGFKDGLEMLGEGGDYVG